MTPDDRRSRLAVWCQRTATRACLAGIMAGIAAKRRPASSPPPAPEVLDSAGITGGGLADEALAEIGEPADCGPAVRELVASASRLSDAMANLSACLAAFARGFAAGARPDRVCSNCLRAGPDVAVAPWNAEQAYCIDCAVECGAAAAAGMGAMESVMNAQLDRAARALGGARSAAAALSEGDAEEDLHDAIESLKAPLRAAEGRPRWGG